MPEKLKRPQRTTTKTTRVTTGCGYIYITEGRSADGLIEVFASLGKTGGCSRCQLEAITRLISLGLKYGILLKEMLDELSGLRCPNSAWDGGQQILSCPDAIAKVLKQGQEDSLNSMIAG